MEYAYSIYFYKILPDDIYLKILDYEWSEQKWYTKLDLDNYTIKNKFAISRQISKIKRDVVLLDYSIIWTKIIQFKKNF